MAKPEAAKQHLQTVLDSHAALQKESQSLREQVDLHVQRRSRLEEENQALREQRDSLQQQVAALKKPPSDVESTEAFVRYLGSAQPSALQIPSVRVTLAQSWDSGIRWMVDRLRAL